MVLPAFSFPPTPLLPAHPLYTSSLILQELKKTITKISSVSCVTELVVIYFSYTTTLATYAVNMAPLQLGINEPEWLEYLKLIFLEI